MSLRPLFEWVHAFPSSIAMRESLYAFPVLLTLHLISLAMFAGLVVMMDLRLLGVAYRGTPFSEVQRRLFPWQMVGMVVTSIAGKSRAWTSEKGVPRYAAPTRRRPIITTSPANIASEMRWIVSKIGKA